MDRGNNAAGEIVPENPCDKLPCTEDRAHGKQAVAKIEQSDGENRSERFKSNIDLFAQVDAMRPHQNALIGLGHIGHDCGECKKDDRFRRSGQEYLRHSNCVSDALREDCERYQHYHREQKDCGGAGADAAARSVVVAGAGGFRYILLERRFYACSAQGDVGGYRHENRPDAVTIQPQVSDHHRDHDDPGQHMHKVPCHAKERVLPDGSGERTTGRRCREFGCHGFRRRNYPSLRESDGL